MNLNSDDLRSMADALDALTDVRTNFGVDIDGIGPRAYVHIHGEPVGALVWQAQPNTDPVDGRFVVEIERAS